MKNQRRNVKLLKIFGKVRFGEGFDAVECVLVSGHYSLMPESVDHALRDLGVRTVGAEKGAAGKILVELRAVDDAGCANIVDFLYWQAI